MTSLVTKSAGATLRNGPPRAEARRQGEVYIRNFEGT